MGGGHRGSSRRRSPSLLFRQRSLLLLLLHPFLLSRMATASDASALEQAANHSVPAHSSSRSTYDGDGSSSYRNSNNSSNISNSSSSSSSNSGSSSNVLLRDFSEQLSTILRPLKPNAEPTVFPPLSVQEKAHRHDSMDWALFCLTLTDAEIKDKIGVVRQIIPLVAAQNGMRESDVLVCLFHHMWAGCYSSALSLPASASLSSLSREQVQQLIQHNNEPFRFKEQTLEEIDKMIKLFAT
ncbi:hypothetical protein, conserved [Eimeria tenella]|uniref:Uncharacterized protein n=1 Tax=Eimeria tenella TaxID=5802 RepID=U6KT96_EIMTE|nr:hypothetical protein, conserved [Eimeria tenella]CDJ40148.1 hypothetical protein, conserved [Eimeria tenella]|eukprot:XP_013230901.1 hypothetical protein, conserved [Eimeria tenella]